MVAVISPARGGEHLAEPIAHHQAAGHREGLVDVPASQPLTIPLLQLQEKGGFHINPDNPSLPKGHSR